MAMDDRKRVFSAPENMQCEKSAAGPEERLFVWLSSKILLPQKKTLIKQLRFQKKTRTSFNHRILK